MKVAISEDDAIYDRLHHCRREAEAAEFEALRLRIRGKQLIDQAGLQTKRAELLRLEANNCARVLAGLPSRRGA